MFYLCSKMKWAHLPVAGGIYDQDPELIDKFVYLFQELDKVEKEEQDKREAEQRQQKAKQARSSPSRGGMRRRSR